MAWCALQGKYNMLLLRVRLKPPCLNDIKLIVIAVRWPNLLTDKRPTSCCALQAESPSVSHIHRSKRARRAYLSACQYVSPLTLNSANVIAKVSIFF